MEKQKEKRTVKYEFTNDEKLNLSRDLALAKKELKFIEWQKRGANADFERRISVCKEEIRWLSRKYSTGYEMREVECDIEFHSPEYGRKTLVRSDGQDSWDEPMTSFDYKLSEDKKIKEKIPVKHEFTNDEKLNLSREMALAKQELTSIVEQKKAANAEFAGQISVCKKQIGQLSRNLSYGYEMREVECDIEFHSPEYGRKTLMRSDGQGSNMRTIKFRGKRIDTGEWVYGHYVNATHCITGDPLHRIVTPDDKTYDIYPETVGQFICMKDGNHKEIYVGDIARRVSMWGNPPGEKYEIIFYYGRFCLKKIDNSTGFKYMYNYKLYEVLGNIHDNPELLKKRPV